MWNGVRISPHQTTHHIDRKNDQRQSDQSFGPRIKTVGQRKLKQNDQAAKQRDHRSMASRIEKPESHRARRLLLNAGNVRDRSDVIVVKSVTEPKYGAGDKSDFERC